MAPEQLEGEAIDARADLYAIALVFHEMLAGRLPFPDRDRTAKLLGLRVGTDALGSPRSPASPAWRTAAATSTRG